MARSAEISTVTVIVGIAGAILLYGAITNRNPIDVIKLTLQGQDIATARTVSTGVQGWVVNPETGRRSTGGTF